MTIRLDTKLEREKYVYPGGAESANYYSYYDGYAINCHFNKHFETVTPVFPDNWEELPELDHSYRDIDSNNFDSDIDDTLENILQLDTCNYPVNPDKQLEGQLQQDDIKAIIHNPDWILDNLIIISPPGSGKTSQIIDYLISKKKKFIFLVPLRLQVEQLPTKHDKLGIYLPGKSKNASSVVDSEPFIVTTYNSFLKINELIKNKWEYYLIIDEFHKLISDSNYRTESLAYIYYNMYLYQRFIGLTGTPFGCINKKLTEKNVKLINIRFKTEFELIKKSYQLIRFQKNESNKEELNPLFYSYIKDNINEGINVVFVNNKGILNKLENQLRAENVIGKNQSKYISSDTKEDPEILEMFINSKVPEGCKLLLATSVMSTGINLNGSQFNNVFIYNESNLIEVIQFIYRFREGINRVFDFIPFDTRKQNKFNFEEEYEELVKTYQKMICKINEVFKENFVFLKQYLPKDAKHLIKNDIFIYNEKLELNENRVRWDILAKLHKRAKIDPSIRIEYLKLYLNENIEKPIIDLRVPHIDVQSAITYNKINRQKSKEISIYNLQNDTHNLISYFKESIKIKNPSLFINKRNAQFITAIDSETKLLFDDQFSELDKAVFKNTISEFLFFYSTGVSINTAVRMAENNSGDKLAMAIQFLRLVRYTKRSSLDNMDIGDRIKNEILFIDDAMKLLSKMKKIKFDEIKLSINKLKGSGELKNFYSKSCKERFSYIFKLADNVKNNSHIYTNNGIMKAKDLLLRSNVPLIQNDVQKLDEYLSASNIFNWAFIKYRWE